MYQRFGGARFEIVSVGIEKDPARWERARGQDGLNWAWQLVEITPSLRFFDSPIANQFSVKKLPTLFLLNPEGEIVLVDVSVEKLTQYLEGKLK
jgi:hypothetical protein